MADQNHDSELSILQSRCGGAHRRMSIEDSTAHLVTSIRSTLNKLTGLWDQVHMDQAAREARVEYAYAHFHTLLKDIVSSEEEMIRGVEMDIEARRAAVKELRQMFKMPPFNESSYPAGSIALLKALDKDMSTLSEQRDEALREQLRLYKELLSAASRTESETPNTGYDDIGDRVLDERELKAMRSQIRQLEALLGDRLARVDCLQGESKKICETLGGNCSISDEDMELLNFDYHSPHSVISEEVLVKCAALNQKLKDEYDSWLEQVAFRYDELLVRMGELSKKCFRPDFAPEQYQLDFKPGAQGERDLREMESKIEALEEKYNRGKPVFDKLSEWMTLWTEKLNAEQRACRTSFYKNRGGSLNNTLRRQKQLSIQVPKVFHDLQALSEAYERDFDVEDILVEGMRPDKYAAYVMEEYDRDKEVQRAQKQFVRQRQDLTPGHASRPYATATVAGGKDTLRRIKATPGTITKGRKRSLSCSQLSVISPVKAPMFMGPKTSSPKLLDFTTATNAKSSPLKQSNVTNLLHMQTMVQQGTSVYRTPKTPKAAGAASTTPQSRPWY